MLYGRFDDLEKEYVIDRPDTPLPWLNYLGQDEFFGLCTNTAGGYTFWKDAKLRRLTRYRYNSVPYDSVGRYLYVNDNGTVWNPGWKPVKRKLDKYECRHGLGYTRFISSVDNVEVEMLVFVPLAKNMEIWKITVRNKSNKFKHIDLFSYQEFNFYDALNDMTNFQRTFSIGEVEVEGNAIYHKTEYRERRNHYTMFASTKDLVGFDTSRDVFVGVHNGLHEANVPFSGKSTDSMAFGWNPVGSHHLKVSLEPGQEESFALMLAYIENEESEKFDASGALNKRKGRELLKEYSDINVVDAEFQKLCQYWDDLLSKFKVNSPNEHVNRMLNIWNQYQCMVTFNLSRSASLYESGIGRGMGYRDSNQDVLGFVHLIPERARERILDIAATQLSDGTCYHQYQPLTKKGNKDIGGDFYDDHLWLILSTSSYIKETGDLSILDERIGYADKTYSNQMGKESLLHHLETSVAYTLAKRGPHGLPLIGHADWNDCLNLNCFSREPNESFQTAGDVRDSKAESVMIAGLFLYATREMEALYSFMGKGDDAQRMQSNYKTMLESVESQAWDGEWYLRAFDASGHPIGSKQNVEGKIFIESQGWCVLGGAGFSNGRATKALESVHKHLFTKNGIMLQQPPYSKYYPELGEISSYPPGVKENAGIFAHNNTWINLALCQLGLGDRALEYYLSICPSAKQDQIETYRSEPYVYAQMIAGKDAPCFGEAKNSWLTGTAAWTFLTASQGLMGVKPQFDGLMIDPCIPKDWDNLEIIREFRGHVYIITIKNPDKVSKGVVKVVMDGVTLSSNILPVKGATQTHQVEVLLG